MIVIYIIMVYALTYFSYDLLYGDLKTNKMSRKFTIENEEQERIVVTVEQIDIHYDANDYPKLLIKYKTATPDIFASFTEGEPFEEYLKTLTNEQILKVNIIND